MPFFNLFLAVLVAFISYRGWSDIYLSIIIGWFAFRVETLLSVNLSTAKMTHAMLEADTARMRLVMEAHEQHVSEIARNN